MFLVIRGRLYQMDHHAVTQNSALQMNAETECAAEHFSQATVSLAVSATEKIMVILTAGSRNARCILIRQHLCYLAKLIFKVCDPSQSTSQWTFLSSQCLIDSQCHGKGGSNPDSQYSQCQV